MGKSVAMGATRKEEGGKVLKREILRYGKRERAKKRRISGRSPGGGYLRECDLVGSCNSAHSNHVIQGSKRVVKVEVPQGHRGYEKLPRKKTRPERGTNLKIG